MAALIPACTRLGAWDIIASGARDQSDGGNASSGKRIPVYLSGIAQSASLSDVPVLVRLIPAVFPYGDCRSDGLDIRFRSSDGLTDLAFERDSWVSGGRSDFWVKVPSIAASPAETRIWMYYGDGSSADASDAAGVWTNGYIAVLHGSYYDSDSSGVLERYYQNSVGSNDADTEGALEPAADLGSSSVFGASSFRFDGTNKVGFSFPAAAAFYNLGPFTFESWMRDTNGAQDDRIVFFKGDNPARKLALTVLNPAKLRFSVLYTTAPLAFETANNFLAFNAWTNIAVTWDGAFSASLFSNGTSAPLTATGPIGTRVEDQSDKLVIGNDNKPAVGTLELFADLDEIRVSNVKRSPAWIAAQYESQRGDRLVFGAAEDVSGGD